MYQIAIATDLRALLWSPQISARCCGRVPGCVVGTGSRARGVKPCHVRVLLSQAPADRVIKAAAAFGSETEEFAKKWVKKALAGEPTEGGLIEECLLDDDEKKCVELEEAMRDFNRSIGRLDGMNS